jgi:hypothetical protein
MIDEIKYAGSDEANVCGTSYLQTEVIKPKGDNRRSRLTSLLLEVIRLVGGTLSEAGD